MRVVSRAAQLCCCQPTFTITCSTNQIRSTRTATEAFHRGQIVLLNPNPESRLCRTRRTPHTPHTRRAWQPSKRKAGVNCHTRRVLSLIATQGRYASLVSTRRVWQLTATQGGCASQVSAGISTIRATQGCRRPLAISKRSRPWGLGAGGWECEWKVGLTTRDGACQAQGGCASQVVNFY